MADNEFKAYLIASGEDLPAFMQSSIYKNLPIGISAYSISPRLAFMKMQLPSNARGRLLILSDAAIENGEEEFASVVASPQMPELAKSLVSRICFECSMLGYTHVFFDFENVLLKDSSVKLILELIPELIKNGYPVYLGELFASSSYELFKGARFIMSLPKNINPIESINNMCMIIPPYKIILDIPRLLIKTSLPQVNSEIIRVSPDELYQELSKEGCTPFYSDEMFINYFTVHEGSKSEYYVFDDSRSILQKLSCATDAGLYGACLLYCETHDILDKIFNR